MRVRIGLVAAVVVVGLAVPALAAAAPALTSSNWAGYALTGAPFDDVRATWTEPVATCPSSGSSFAAFWVGLGGFSGGVNGLEQIGSQTNCSGGAPAYAAWYELLPAGSVTLPVVVSPGDTISAEVAVAGANVTLSLTDVTTGAAFTTTVALAGNLDTSSAEWIAEAPSRCLGSFGACEPLPLADFGTVAFASASATSDHTGTISDPGWSATAIQLRDLGASAVPSAPSPDGSSFGVAWQGAQAASSAPPSRRRRHPQRHGR